MKKTWTRNDIIEAISDNVGLSLSESSIIIEEIFELILSGLENGEDVKISSFEVTRGNRARKLARLEALPRPIFASLSR